MIPGFVEVIIPEGSIVTSPIVVIPETIKEVAEAIPKVDATETFK